MRRGGINKELKMRLRMNFSEILRIESERIVLAPMGEGERAMLGKLLEDSRVTKTYMVPVFSSVEERERLVDAFLRLSGDEKRFVRGIFLDGAFVGFINDVGVEGDGIELGYVVSPDFLGRGICTKALRAAISALIGIGFGEVLCGAFEENGASLRVMEKCSMKRIESEETIEYRGISHRCVYFSYKKQSN